MGSLFISLLTLVLILISGFVILLVLMQRTSDSGGMGAALGGGASESAFGSDTNNILRNATIYSIIAFFMVSLGLFLIYQSKAAERTQTLNPKELIRAENPDPGLAEGLLTTPEVLPESVVNSVDNESLSVKNEIESTLETTKDLPVDADVSKTKSAGEMPAQ